jgi:glycosyltransferase involved in cell wall biosynthesis
MAKRILISGGLAGGGVQTHVTHLYKLLRGHGAEVTIAAVSTHWSGDDLRAARQAGVDIVVTPWRYGAASVLGKAQAVATWRLKMRRDFDVLYCIGHGRMHSWLRRFVKEGGVAVYHESGSHPERESVAARVAAEMDFIVASSSPIAKEMGRVLPGHAIKVIPFITSDRATAAPARKRAVGDGVLRVSYLGRLVRSKQPDWLVREWRSMAGRAPVAPARLDVYGSDDPGEPLLAEMQAFINAEGLGSQIKLHGAYRHADVSSILERTDLVALPSRTEGLPLVLVEAMRHGVPFVAMSAGGVAELGEGNADVEIVPVDNDAFREGLARAARKVRSGQINSGRLHQFAESRYGAQYVNARWRAALLDADVFWKEGRESSGALTTAGRR